MVPLAILPTLPHLCIVEQVPYQCKAAQKVWTLLKTIDFRIKGVEGMKLTDAMGLHFDGLDGRDDDMFENEGVGTSVSCRIHVRRFYDSNSYHH